jgi:hypothetical protein
VPTQRRIAFLLNLALLCEPLTALATGVSRPKAGDGPPAIAGGYVT